ncbi:MAG: Rrf2 family transcriptional regulator [Sedimentisphaerales bacterium]|jgi:Rrf2 family cysteine metabolism transcriptional repressor
MRISKKCQYALRAVFELAWRNTGEPVKTHSIARAQGMSSRFTEVILNELKHARFVESKRGKEGGYLLAKDARDLTVGEVIEHIQGPISFAPDATQVTSDTTYSGAQAFRELWKEINRAVSEVCDSRTFADLVRFEENRRRRCVPDYTI